MSEFRLWVHHQIARLDRASERRFVALASALVFAVLALGPQALRVVDAAVNAPDIRIDELGANPVSNPVRFKATTLNVQLGNLDFLVRMPDSSMLPLPGQRTSADPSIWTSPDFNGAPGQSYEVRARGLSSAGTAVESSQSVVFSIFDPNSGGASAPPPTGSPSQTTPKTVVLQHLVAFPGTEPKIEARGRHEGFTADSAFFRIRSLSGLAFLAERDAVLENGAWHGVYAVPGGSLYQVTLVAREGATLRESDPLTVAVPVAETPPTAPDPTQPPPPPPAAISLLLPDAGASLASPVTLAARVANASATSVIFEVLDPAGVTRQLPGQPEAAGGWSVMFFGEAGQYRVGVRASLSDGSIISSTDFRSFGILAPATEPEPAPTEPAAPEPAPAPVPEEPAAAPFVELFTPAADAPPFGGTVPIAARVRNGLPERVVAVVIAPTGAETVVIASKSATGDFWNALFEGPDGEYRFRVRALVAGTEIFSTDRRFAIKKPLTAAPPPPPPAPAPAPTTVTGTAPTTALPPPPPPPSGPVAEPEGSTDAVGINVDARDDGLGESAPAAMPIPEALALECRQAGIAPERCAEWLKAKYQSRECLEAGAFTREACAALLGRLNIAPDESKLMGLPPLSAITQAREDAGKILAAPVRREDLPPSISALLPVERDQRAFVRVLEVANAGETSSPALIVIDSDGDGLPNDVERRFGTDPEAPDTDGDGFSDGEEVKNGYNPLGAGTLERPVRGVEKALIEGRALEEPRGSDATADPSFMIASAEPVPEAEADGEDIIRLSGTAAPNSVVTIFVYSYLPVVVTTTTDENGNWTYDFGSKLAEGRHEAYVSVNDETGKLVASSSPLAFFVREAQAVSEEEFLRPDVNVEETPATLSRWFVYGGIGLVVLALVLVAAIVRQVRKDPLPGSGEGL